MTEASDVSFGLEITKGVIGKFLMAILGFIGTIVFARFLGPVAFGGYYIIWSIVQVTSLPIDGFSIAGKKRFSESDTNRSTIVGAVILMALVITVVVISGAFIFREQLASYTGNSNSAYIFSILLISVVLFGPFQTLLSGTGQLGLTVWIDLFRSVLTTPFQIALVLLGWGAMGMAFGLTAATIITAPIGYYYLRVVPSVPDRDTLTSLWSYARYSIPGTTVGRIYNKFDILALGFLFTSAASGQYEVALKLTMPAFLLSNIVGNGLMARVSNLRSKGESVNADISNALSFSSILSIPIFFGALTLSEPLVVTVYGPEYTDAAQLLIGLALFRVFESQSNPLAQVLNGLDRPDINVKLGVIALCVNAIVGIPLAIWVGPIGVVIGTILAEALKYVGCAYYLRQKQPNIPFISDTLRKQFLGGIVMASVVFIFRRSISISSLVELIGLVGLGAAVYSSVLFIISERFRITIEGIIYSYR